MHPKTKDLFISYKVAYNKHITDRFQASTLLIPSSPYYSPYKDQSAFLPTHDSHFVIFCGWPIAYIVVVVIYHHRRDEFEHIKKKEERRANNSRVFGRFLYYISSGFVNRVLHNNGFIYLIKLYIHSLSFIQKVKAAEISKDIGG